MTNKKKITAVIKKGEPGDMQIIDLQDQDGKVVYSLLVKNVVVETGCGCVNVSQIDNLAYLHKILANINDFVDRKPFEAF